MPGEPTANKLTCEICGTRIKMRNGILHKRCAKERVCAKRKIRNEENEKIRLHKLRLARGGRELCD